MAKGHRVGSLTAGIVLVGFGLLFISRSIFPHLDTGFIFSLWPIILIILGIEVLVSYFFGEKKQIKYDGGAIALIMILALFAIALAGAEFFINNLKDLNIILG